MPLTLQITDAGRAALVNAGHDGTNAVRVASVGVSPTAIVAAPGTAALPGELKRIATIAGDAVAEDVLHMVVRDESADSYTLRSFALYLEDGTLFAAYGQPDPIMEKSAQALLLLAVDVALTDVTAAQVTFGDTDFLNPPATTDRQGVVELADDAEMLALADKLRAVTPAGLAKVFTAANILARLGYTPANRAGENFTGDVTAAHFASTGNPGFSARGAAPYYQFANADDTLRHGYIAHAGVFGGALTINNEQGGVIQLVTGENPGMTVGPSGAFVSGVFAVNGNTGWHAGNDGSGSGSDSDMLDGHHASEFALLSGATFTGPIFGTGISLSQGITAPMGFYLSATSYFGKPTPTLVDYTPDSGDTMRFDQAANQWDWYIDSNFKLSIRPTMVLISDALTVGGPLSAPNMMAETFATSTSLGRAYLQIISGNTASTGYIEFRRADNTREGYIGFVGTGAAMPFVCENGAGFAFNGGLIARDGNRVWDAGNDGAGSGSDSDMLDGWHRDDIRNWNNLLNKPGSFPPSAHTHGAAEIAAAFPTLGAANGYVILPSGLILQWGRIRASYGSETVVGVTFPTTFPTACLNAQATGFISSASTARDLWPQICGEPGSSGMTVQLQSDDNDNWSLQGFNWWAVGY